MKMNEPNSEEVRRAGIKAYTPMLEIYLKHAYPNNKDNVHFDKMAWLRNPTWAKWDKKGIPNEARFGCHVNPHMKLRYYHAKYEGDDEFWAVDTNDHPDPQEVRDKCKDIRDAIENEWREKGYKVIERRTRCRIRV